MSPERCPWRGSGGLPTPSGPRFTRPAPMRARWRARAACGLFSKTPRSASRTARTTPACRTRTRCAACRRCTERPARRAAMPTESSPPKSIRPPTTRWSFRFNRRGVTSRPLTGTARRPQPCRRHAPGLRNSSGGNFHGTIVAQCLDRRHAAAACLYSPSAGSTACSSRSVRLPASSQPTRNRSVLILHRSPPLDASRIARAGAPASGRLVRRARAGRQCLEGMPRPEGPPHDRLLETVLGWNCCARPGGESRPFVPERVEKRWESSSRWPGLNGTGVSWRHRHRSLPWA